MQKIALQTAGSFFLIVAVLHALRLAFKAPITVGRATIPMSFSWFGAVFCAVFAVWMFLAS